MDKISIITVCYNSDKTIEQTFESLLNQTDSNFEYIIIDGNSTDNTLNLIKKYKEKFGERMKYISESDSGLYDAMNKGIALCSGDYIGILNSDDWYELDAIKSIRTAIHNSPEIDIFYGYIRIIKDNKEYMVRRNNYDFIFEATGLIQHPTCFLKKELYNKFGTFNTKYRICADIELLLRMISNNAKYMGVDKIITNFALGGASDNYDSSLEMNDIKYKYKIITEKQMKKFIFKKKLSLLLNKVRKIKE